LPIQGYKREASPVGDASDLQINIEIFYQNATAKV
jgi:hypothetical protein